MAERIRPRLLSEFIGQTNLIHENSLLTKAVGSKQPFSLIFWGPPGTGKTTLARILSREFGAEYLELSAISSGVKQGAWGQMVLEYILKEKLQFTEGEEFSTQKLYETEDG